LSGRLLDKQALDAIQCLGKCQHFFRRHLANDFLGAAVDDPDDQLAGIVV
jgi:hypothetical protein